MSVVRAIMGFKKEQDFPPVEPTPGKPLILG
jgi:hypothetical protein